MFELYIFGPFLGVIMRMSDIKALLVLNMADSAYILFKFHDIHEMLVSLRLHIFFISLKVKM